MLNHLQFSHFTSFSDDFPSNDDTLLHAAVRGSSHAVNVLRLLIKKAHGDANAYRGTVHGETCWNTEATGLETYYYQTVLQVAVGLGDEGPENVKYLIKKGADVNLRVSIPEYDDGYDVKDVGENEGL